MTTHSNTEWRSYVAMLVACSATVIGAVAALNYQLDPYLIHQWDTPQLQRLQPGRERLSAWGKTYALARFKPAIVYVGNSRTELGLPTGVTTFAGLDVFNGALSGASLSDAMAMVRHAAAVSDLKAVAWGIDAPSFSMEIGNSDFDRELVADGPWYLWRRRLLNLKRAVTLDMTTDSIRLLKGTFSGNCRSSLALHGQRDDACMRERIDGWGGTSTAIVPRVREYIRGSGPTAEAMRAMENSVGELCRGGTSLRLYVNPTHAMTSYAWYWSGKWPELETWLTQLADLGARHRASGCDLRIYDFSGFNSITSESIPQVSGRPDMRYYWEPSHYRKNVGQMILSRMFGDGAGVPDDFGVELTPAGIAIHLAHAHAARDSYQAQHPEEARMVREIVAAH
jgi:hypothetical protein